MTGMQSCLGGTCGPSFIQAPKWDGYMTSQLGGARFPEHSGPKYTIHRTWVGLWFTTWIWSICRLPNELSNVVLWVPSHVRWCSVAGLTNLGVPSHKSPIRTLRSNQNVPKTDTHVTCHMLEDIFQPLISAWLLPLPCASVRCSYCLCCGMLRMFFANEHQRTPSNAE